MSTTIILPDDIARRLEARASARQVSLEELIADLLSDVLDRAEEYLTLDRVIAEIKETQPGPDTFHPATQSLADMLANSPEDPSFDEQAWNRQWAEVEAEMREATRANDLAEGRA